MKYARLCRKPALDYYKEHLQGDLMSVPLKLLKLQVSLIHTISTRQNQIVFHLIVCQHLHL